MPNNQVRIRRDTGTNLAAATPADGELGYDTTNDRLVVGDGLTAGGIHIPNFRDIQNGTYVYIAAGGTADVLTFTLAKAPAAYVEGLEFRAKGTLSNATTTPTGNVNGLGAKNFKKYSGGAKVNLAAGDIWNGFQMIIRYDGTDLVILNVPSTSGLVTVGQGDLRTSSGSVSVLYNSAANYIILVGTSPAGEYGFGLRGNWSGGSNVDALITKGIASTDTSAVSKIYAHGETTSTNRTISVTERYVTASPPYDLGEGEVSGFVFLKLAASGEVLATYTADTPPWAYNGPTRIKPDYIDAKTGRKFKEEIKQRTIEEIMAGAPVEKVLVEITQEVKNADMAIIPHPFGELLEGETACLVDPLDQRVRALIDAQNDGDGSLTEAINKGQLYCDNIELRRKGPNGVHIGRLRYKNSKAGS